jgi:hypothetical protein
MFVELRCVGVWWKDVEKVFIPKAVNQHQHWQEN